MTAREKPLKTVSRRQSASSMKSSPRIPPILARPARGRRRARPSRWRSPSPAPCRRRPAARRRGRRRSVEVDGAREIALADGRSCASPASTCRIPRAAPPWPRRARASSPAVSSAARRRWSFRRAPGSLGSGSADLAAPPPDGAPVVGRAGARCAGLARVRPEFETRGCVAAAPGAEAEARAKGLGVWRDPDYSVLAAGRRGTRAERRALRRRRRDGAQGWRWALAVLS